MTEFEQNVLRDLAELKMQMRALVGNGQPGRIHELEARVEKHEALVQRAIGIGALAGFVGTMFHVGLDFLLRHRS
jgi:hypothetical protein